MAISHVNGVAVTTGSTIMGRSGLSHINGIALASGGGGGLLIDENFEGAGTPSGWSINGGSPNFDNATVPMAGSQDLKLFAGDDVQVAFTASDEVWWMCRFKNLALPASTDRFIYMASAGFSAYGAVSMTTSGALQLYQQGVGLVGSATVDATAADTEYYLFGHFKKGSGANGIYEIEFSTTNTRVGSGNKFASYSSGNMTSQFAFMDWTCSGNFGAFQIDDMKISNTGWPTP